jgi:hypothetical protein
MRVAVVIEQCWHRVPGGTASATLDQIAAVAATGRVDQTGVAARHRKPAPAAWRPEIPVRHLPLPRQALYRSWHRLRWPPVQRATGAVDVVHATGYAVPPRTAPLVVTLHDLAWRRDPSMFTRNGVRFFEAALRCTLDEADLVLVPGRPAPASVAASEVARRASRHRRHPRWSRAVRSRRCGRARRWPGWLPRWGRARRRPGRPAP